MKITVEIAPTEIVEINRKLNKFDGKKYADIISIISNSINKAFQETMKNL